MGKNLWISGSILLFLAGVIIGSAFIGTFLFTKINPVEIAQPVSLLPVDAGELPANENLTPLSVELDQELSQLQEEVIGIRQLMPDQIIFRETLNADQLRERVINDFFADYSEDELKRDTLLYAILGAIEPDFDLYTFIVDLYSEQIAGYYDDETKEMVVVQGGDFGGPERMTYAHEFTHLLQDQTYDFDDGLNLSEDLLDQNMDAYAALQALVEGDAVMSEYLWYQDYATEMDTMDVQEFSTELSTPIYDQAPVFIQNELLFPYQYGLEFVHSVYAAQGWEGVADLYQNPPQSTEQILHPERYPLDIPLTVSLQNFQDQLPAGWRLLHESTFGEAYHYLLLSSQTAGASMNLSPLWQAVEGWGGDRYQLYLNDESGEVIFLLKTIWDTEADAKEFTAAFFSYAAQRWPEGSASQSTRYTAVDPNFSQMNFQQDGSTTYWWFVPQESYQDRLLTELNLAGEK